MESVRGAAAVVAAQAGDPRAQDQLVAEYMPLVYNIVGRALGGHPDVDDVVQETMLHMIDGLSGLRDPGCFRSWLVAIAMNQVRRNWRLRQLGDTGGVLDEAHDVADPGADFVDLTIVRLGLSGQRRQVAEATRWLDADDRALLSLWWLEAAGELTRAEVAAALELTPQHAAVRIQRMKAQLETARVVVRALWAVPRCAELMSLTEAWDGAPGALWRKRIARHTRECTACARQWSDLVPAEGLLAGLAMLPLPPALAAAGTGSPALGPGPGHAQGHGGAIHPAHGHPGATPPHAPANAPHGYGPSPAQGEASAAHPAHGHPGTTPPHAPANAPHGYGPSPAQGEASAAHPAHGHPGTTPPHAPANAPHGYGPSPAQGQGATAPGTGHGAPSAGGASGTVGRAAARHGRRRVPGPRPRVAGAAAAAVLAGGLYFTVAPGASHADVPVTTAKATATHPVAAPTHPSASPTPRPRPTVPAKPPVRRSTPAPRPRPAAPTVQEQVLSLLNSARAQYGCAPLRSNAQLQAAAQRHSDDMAARRLLDHTDPDGTGPADRITAAGYRWNAYAENIAYGQRGPGQVMSEWMNSPPHRQNILNCSLRDVGIGVDYGPGGPWWTQDFGTRN